MKLFFSFWLTLLLCHQPISGQHISLFTSLAPGTQDNSFHLPPSHTFQYLIEHGDPLSAGGTLPDNCDFAGFVPINGSSRQGYLGINSESAPGGHTILDLSYDSLSFGWAISASQQVSFSSVFATAANCSGTVTPWNTIISCEEVVLGDFNLDGYNDLGWAIEIDPGTRTVVDQRGDFSGGDKLWAMGCFAHENAVVHTNLRTVYQGADSNPGYLYRFVADSTEDLSTGKLYVYVSTGATTGKWKLLPNSSVSERNNTLSQSALAGARVFNGIEDVEISPIDGKVYFAVKNENRVYRFTDSDPVNDTLVSNFETYVGGMSYSLDLGSSSSSEPWGTGNDNLAFDDLGNLWVCQDGGNNYIWLVEVGHTQINPKVKIYGRTPLGSEPTGMTFSPDFTFMFLSIQHPSSLNVLSTQPDAFGQGQTFDKDVVLVIGRREHLGDQPLAFAEPDTGEAVSFIDKVRIFPNPISRWLHIERFPTSAFFSEIALFDLQGKTLLRKSLESEALLTDLDLSYLQPGTYWLRYTLKDGHSAGRKVIVE